MMSNESVIEVEFYSVKKGNIMSMTLKMNEVKLLKITQYVIIYNNICVYCPL